MGDNPMKTERSSGILLHITSLPSAYGIGDLGRNAFDFVDFLAEAGQSVWQILPTVPIGPGFSPYMSPSTFAGNTLLICPETLREMGLLTSEDLKPERPFEIDRVDYARVVSFKKDMLQQAFVSFSRNADSQERSGFETWCECESHWLEDYALFETLQSVHPGSVWMQWSPELVGREKHALGEVRERYGSTYDRICFGQYVFQRQWEALRSHANGSGVGIVGDLPIYVAQNSADVWSHRDIFELDASGYPTVVAGVPPDYFSETGQYWGNPIYDWEAVKETGYWWWIRRLSRILNLVDLVRLDHFRGFEAYWEVPASEETAVNGRWVKGPGADFFRALEAYFGRMPIIAENLGVITDEVTDLMAEFGFPGMAILQFALDGEMDGDYLPHNLKEDLVAYTGTHDNDTLLGWWQHPGESDDEEEMERIRSFTRDYLKLEGKPESEVVWTGIEALMASDANTVIFPLQDILCLDSRARMNTPGTSEGNWEWRVQKRQIVATCARRLCGLTKKYGR